jgi:SpoU rRNA methylase family enzyme
LVAQASKYEKEKYMLLPSERVVELARNDFYREFNANLALTRGSAAQSGIESVEAYAYMADVDGLNIVEVVPEAGDTGAASAVNALHTTIHESDLSRNHIFVLETSEIPAGVDKRALVLYATDIGYAALKSAIPQAESLPTSI